MTFAPLRVRAMEGTKTLCVNDSGRFFASSGVTVERLARGQFNDHELAILRRDGHWIEHDDPLAMAAYKRAVARRLSVPGTLDYLILVPTLRCNLACSYCQVSRVNEAQPGFDWSDETLSHVLAQIDRLEGNQVKVEFQGGEPTLRMDLIKAVIERASRFERRQFVICTNLQRLDDEMLALFERPDVVISTSLDGDAATHRKHRTKTGEATANFYANLRTVVDRFGPSKVSALPTVDAEDPPDPGELIDTFVEYGIDSVFLRPINYQGFARKRHAASRTQDETWRAYYERFVFELIERNWSDRGRVLEETYLSIGLRRIFRPDSERHVDLRNPNPMGIDYLVIDHDGMIYPTDEARMLTRSSVVDLSIGDVATGCSPERREQLNAVCSNQFDPDCMRCAYQPYCGRDVIDDLARYGRIDLPRHETEFCRKHMHLFDFIFRLIYTDSPKVRYSLAKWLRLPSTPSSFGEVLQ